MHLVGFIIRIYHDARLPLNAKLRDLFGNEENDSEMRSGPSESYKQATDDWKHMSVYVYVYGTERCKEKQWTFSDTGNCLINSTEE